MNNIDQQSWFARPLAEQMANIGTEVGRAMEWQITDPARSTAAFYNAIDLLDLTIEDKKNRGSAMTELCRLKEALGDYFLGDNIYGSTKQNWNSYFYFFNVAASAKYF